MPTLNMDALMNERAQQLGSTQTVINKDPNPIRVTVNTFRQTTKHNINHNKPHTCYPPRPQRHLMGQP